MIALTLYAAIMGVYASDRKPDPSAQASPPVSDAVDASPSTPTTSGSCEGGSPCPQVSITPEDGACRPVRSIHATFPRPEPKDPKNPEVLKEVKEFCDHQAGQLDLCVAHGIQRYLFDPKKPTPRVTGVSVAIVRPDQPPLLLGMGISGIGSMCAIDPKKTLFPVGSVSKLITSTAIMRLVDGKKTLSLDTDVNEYLGEGFVEENFGTPITLRQLLTHTSGLDIRFQAYAVSRKPPADPDTALAVAIKAHLPDRVRPPLEPGKADPFASVYSNWGLALAGFVAERHLNQPFNQVAYETVFKPLGMEHSTFLDPPPARFTHVVEPHTTVSLHNNEDSALLRRDEPVYHAAIMPAGSMLTTAEDAARFMSAILSSLRGENPSFLSKGAAETMLSRQFDPAPSVPGRGLGFMEKKILGETAWGHSGDTTQATTALFVIPKLGIGIYISANSTDIGDRLDTLMMRIVGQITGHGRPEQPVKVKENLKQYEGTYRLAASSQNTVEKVLTPLLPSMFIRVMAMEDHLCIASQYPITKPLEPIKNPETKLCDLPGLRSSNWDPIGGGGFQDHYWGDVLQFITEPGKGVTGFVGMDPAFSYLRIAGWQHPPHHLMLAYGLALVFVAFIAVYPLATMAVNCKVEKPSPMRGLHPAGGFTMIAGVLGLAGAAALVWSLPATDAWFFGYPRSLIVALSCFSAHAVIGGATALWLLVSLRHGVSLWIAAWRLFQAAVLLMSIALLEYYNLIGFRLG